MYRLVTEEGVDQERAGRRTFGERLQETEIVAGKVGGAKGFSEEECIYKCQDNYCLLLFVFLQ